MDEPTPPLSLTDAVGGVRGMVDSALPTVVFVVVYVVTDLRPAVVAAVAAGVAVCLLRLARRQPLRQAVGGFAGVAVSALVAARTGKAEGYFLPGILLNAGYGAAALLSVLVGHPGIGYVAGVVDRRFAAWRETPALRRAATYATLVWAAVFLGRAGLQGWLYAHEHVGWLAAARLGMGLPLFAAAIAVSVVLVRRAAPVENGRELHDRREEGREPA